MDNSLQVKTSNALDLLKVTSDSESIRNINKDYKEKYGFSDKIINDTDFGAGLSEDIIKKISKLKNEDKWMRDYRLKAYKFFKESKLPNWGADLTDIDFDKIHYFVRATDKSKNNWNDVPDEIKGTFDKLGIPEAERKFLAGVSTQYESEVVYHNIKKNGKNLE